MSSTVRSPRRLALGTVAAAVTFVLATPLAAHATYSTTADDTARVNGKVFAIANTATHTYIGGEFTTVGSVARGGIAAIKVAPGTTADGKLEQKFVANTNGVVNAVAVSGGTVFLGGKFTTVNGVPRANLAAVDATTGAVIEGWSADTSGTTPEVLALAVKDGDLFVGGRFGGIDGRTTFKRLAAVTVSTGNVRTSFAPKPNLAAVKFINADADEPTIFVGGAFSTIGGVSRPSGIAELNTSNGSATPFAPSSNGSVVTAMGAPDDGDELYFGVANNEVHAYSTAGAGTRLWTIKNGGDTQAIDVTDDEIFLGGHFGQNVTQKIKRQWVLSTDLAGKVTSWDAKLGGGRMGVWAIDATASHVHIGGEFTSVNGANRPRYVRFDAIP